ncbi:helix-turn-helix domain-containing protein [Mameliella alba]|nr:helix-turn-helix domain-containing protein [Mameliella alba]MBY6171361.1 helix-turn-helix domain-containing protein [Mameliella alba]MBY6176585.1 helix-turn-helix domain-containing protein [Mameliella alba]
MELSRFDTTGNYRSLSRFPEIMESAHWHMHLELVYCSGTRVDYVLGTEYVTLDRGDLCLFWAAIPHRVSGNSDDAHVYVINLPMEALLSAPLPDGFKSHVIGGQPIVTQPPPRFREDAFESWNDDLSSGDTMRAHLAQREIACLVERMAWRKQDSSGDAFRLRPGAHQPKTQQMLSRVIDHVARNCSATLTVAGIAEELGYNKRYLTTRFRELSGVPLQTYIRHMKVSRGQALLTGTNLSIEEIAWEAGFGSVRQFYDVIKSETGMTPKQVRHRELLDT